MVAEVNFHSKRHWALFGGVAAIARLSGAPPDVQDNLVTAQTGLLGTLSGMLARGTANVGAPRPPASGQVASGKEKNIAKGTKIESNEKPFVPDYIATSNGDIGSTAGLGPRKLTALQRELQVAEITGGRSAQTSRIGAHGDLVVEDTRIYRDRKVVSGIDVFGKNGELIQVGGPGKNADDVIFERTKRALQALQGEATIRGTTAQVYYEAGTSERFDALILESQKILGKENVFIFNKKD